MFGFQFGRRYGTILFNLLNHLILSQHYWTYSMPYTNDTIDPQQVKKQSEKIILGVGGEILDWLPTIESPEPRAQHEVVNRALILNAMYQLHMKAPKSYIVNWIEANSLFDELTPKERAILSSRRELTEEEHAELYYSLEALWAIAWATNLVAMLPFNQQVGSELAGLSPDLRLDEDGYKYINSMQLRTAGSIYAMLDLYYRLHWWLNNAARENASTGNIHLDIVKERRKALEWILNRNKKWDEMDLSL